MYHIRFCSVSPNATYVYLLPPLLYTVSLTHYFHNPNSILVKKASLPGFWTFMYYVSPFTWLASGLLSTGVANTAIVCASNEYVKFLPPAGESCGSYMASYISSSGGYLIDVKNTEYCEFCQLSNTNEYLSTVNIRFEDRWRNFGIVLVYIVVNAAGALGVYWLVRVRKRGGSLEKPKGEHKK